MLARLQPLPLPFPYREKLVILLWYILTSCFSFPFIVLPDRPLQLITTSTRALNVTSWRCHQRRMMRRTSPSRSYSWVPTFPGWTCLCAALSRAIWILTVLGRVCLPHDVLMYCWILWSLVWCNKYQRRVYALDLYIYFLVVHAYFTCCRESDSNTSASIVRRWPLMRFYLGWDVKATNSR